jgi:hydrogenase maturation protein HypF
MDRGKQKIITNRIKVYGIVQGVGFRPLVYHIAKNHGIKGMVRNVGGYVEILAQAEDKQLEEFLHTLKTQESSGEITAMELEIINEEEYDDFTIKESSCSHEVAILPPDLSVCPQCERELFDNNDRRYQNPFISCMSCGPRYTILEELPYDRNHTTMNHFTMCPTCQKEYSTTEDRRFHAQTISCNDCGPFLIYQPRKNQLSYHRDNQKTVRKTNQIEFNDQSNDTEKILLNNQALMKAVAAIRAGEIVAVKGIGGYHFVCSPFIDDTVQKLRTLKGREEKPFAVMFENISTMKEYCYVSKEEEELLLTKAKPIVLLYLKEDKKIAPSTGKGSIYCGAFLPYTPLQILLINLCGPLIMTSANLSNQPIIKDDDAMLAVQSHDLTGVLYHTRKIYRSVDDSVAKIMDQKPQLIRRSRGYVPYPVFLTGGKRRQIFAAGGDLKSCFCLYHNGHAVISQYFGDLEEYSILREYQTSREDLTRLLHMQPDYVVCDLHPGYHSTNYAKSLGLPLLQVQHHHAHIASVMAEHDLKGKVIGVAFDGTGYGTDGNIWGGEFLLCEGAEYRRLAHLRYTPMLGSDASMRDAKKTATCYLAHYGLENYINDSRTDIIMTAISMRINTVLTSSMGRLFDAVASILDICQENHYEGEGAILLEKMAVLAIRNEKKGETLQFKINEFAEHIEIDPLPILESLCRLRGLSDIQTLALGFHYAVADMILQVCIKIRQKQNCSVVALSGGVFQNTVLTEGVCRLLRDNQFQVFINNTVPPNDGSISLGQAYVGAFY